MLSEKISLAVKCLKEMHGITLGAKEALLACGAAALYEKTGDEGLKEEIISLALDMVSSDVKQSEDLTVKEYPGAFAIMYLAYNIADEHDKELIKKGIAERYKSEEYTGMYFDMKYETMFGGKEKYHKLVNDFVALADRSKGTEEELALYMLALIYTIEAIDQPVYELYRTLVDLFRSEMDKLASAPVMTYSHAKVILSCAVKKACDDKVILAEKYEAAAVDCLWHCSEDDECYLLAKALTL